MINQSARHQKGMAIMDVVIILSVVAVLTAIMFPKFTTMLHRSREGRTMANLSDIRGAIAIYYSDHSGLFPSDEGTPETRLSSDLVPKYLPEMPPVDLSHYHPEKLNTVQDRFNHKGDWVYTTLNGHVFVNTNHVDTHGKPISEW